MIIPTFEQWKKWSLPSKLTAIGTYLGIISFLIFIVDKCITRYNKMPNEKINSITINKFSQEFDSVSIEYFKKKGWLFFDFDSSYLVKEQFPGSLRLYTLPGDLWYYPKGDPKQKITNLMVKKIECEECSISLKIDDFDPICPWQQVGIYLFNDKNGKYDIDNWARITFGFGGEAVGITDKRWWKIIQIIVYKNGHIMDDGERIQQGIDYNRKKEKLNIKSIFLKVNISDSKLDFFYKKNDAGRNYVVVDKGNDFLDLSHLKPKHIGLAAFSCYYEGNDKCLDEEKTIPANIDYIRLDSLK